MLAQPAFMGNSRFKNVCKLVFFALVAVYITDWFTPLRMHFDSVRYYAIKDCIEFGCPPDSDAANDYFPYGYTALLVILSKLGILKSFSIVVINCIYLFGGLYFLYKMFENKMSPYFFFTLVLLNWLFVKFVAHPLSEMQYIFFSLGSILYYHRFIQYKKIKFLFLSFFLGWLAFMTKTVGITLVGALAVGLLWEYKEQQLAFLKNNRLLVAVLLTALVGALVVFSKPLGINHYGNVLSDHFKEASLMKRVEWRFKEWGEIFLNVPSNKAARIMGNAGNLLFVAIGIVVFCWFIVAMFFKKSSYPFFIKAYFLFYCIIMFNWPFNDPRFWVPVMPLMAVVVAQASFDTNKILKTISSLFLVVYLAFGAFASGYMVYTSLNKEVFARTQASGVYRNEYETYFFGKPQSDTAKRVDPVIIHLLERYNK